MRSLRIAFVRPRLGVGGSERLVVDAARELSRRGHQVTIHAPAVRGEPQFSAVASRRLNVDAAGGWLPVAIGGRLRAPCAILRAAIAGLAAARDSPDLVFCDVAAHVVPLVRRRAGCPVIFYCHFPDMLLTVPGARSRRAYRIYRRPLDRLEALGLAAADLILVNSNFTAETLAAAVPGAGAKLRVLYPGVEVAPSPPGTDGNAENGTILLLSVARFDPRKGLALAIDALVQLRELLARDVFDRVRLTLAGHLDGRWPEALAVVNDLKQRAAEHGLAGRVEFVLSPTDGELGNLMRSCRLFLYTPSAEHFGYGPLEAMAAARPVVAVDRGGPSETVIDGQTGRLCAPDAAAFARAIGELIGDPERARTMGAAGRALVLERFSLTRFGDELESACLALAPGSR